MKLTLMLSGLSPDLCSSTVDIIKSNCPEIAFDEFCGVADKRYIGNFDIVGASTVISAVVSVIALGWSVRSNKNNIRNINQHIEKKNIEISYELRNDIVQVFEKNGGEIIVSLNSKQIYKLKVVNENDDLVISGDFTE